MYMDQHRAVISTSTMCSLYTLLLVFRIFIFWLPYKWNSKTLFARTFNINSLYWFHIMYLIELACSPTAIMHLFFMACFALCRIRSLILKTNSKVFCQRIITVFSALLPEVVLWLQHSRVSEPWITIPDSPDVSSTLSSTTWSFWWTHSLLHLK